MFWEEAKHVLFLVAKKSTKRRRLKGTFRKGRTDGMIATGNHRYCRFAARSTTLKKPLRAHRRPVSKNVPIFEHLHLKPCKFALGRRPKIGTFSGVGWRCGGGFQRGRIFVAPRWPISLVTFLFGNKKVTLPYLLNCKNVYFFTYQNALRNKTAGRFQFLTICSAITNREGPVV